MTHMQELSNEEQKAIDDKVSVYMVLTAAEHGCPQRYIRHVAYLTGVDWPPPGKLEPRDNWEKF